MTQLVAENNFLFFLVGSDDTLHMIESWSRFWLRFNVKHKFVMAYVHATSKASSRVPTFESSSSSSSSVKWFTIGERAVKDEFLARFFCALDRPPKLVVIDTHSGLVINDEFKSSFDKFFDQLCADQMRLGARSSKHNSKHDDHHQQEQQQQQQQQQPRRRRLNGDLLAQLNESLIDLSCGKKLKSSTLKNDEKEHSHKSFFMLYFCSDFTMRNEGLLESAMDFLCMLQAKMGGKSSCRVKIVLVSSDASFDDYKKLLRKFLLDRTVIKHEQAFGVLSLDYRAAHVKEQLMRKLRVLAIPWLSVLESHTGHILCNDLKTFLSNSQLSYFSI